MLSYILSPTSYLSESTRVTKKILVRVTTLGYRFNQNIYLFNNCAAPVPSEKFMLAIRNEHPVFIWGALHKFAPISLCMCVFLSPDAPSCSEHDITVSSFDKKTLISKLTQSYRQTTQQA